MNMGWASILLGVGWIEGAESRGNSRCLGWSVANVWEEEPKEAMVGLNIHLLEEWKELWFDQ
jgi:hypothetical protein